MSEDQSASNLTTDAIPRPPRISEENLHVENSFDAEKPRDNAETPTAENDSQNDGGPTFPKHKIPHSRAKFKSKPKSGEGVINYNIVNSNGIKIGSTTNYTLNLNKISNHMDDYLTSKKVPVRPMSESVEKLCRSKEEITVQDMLLIKMHLGSGWKDVARKIGFSDGQIYQFVQKHKEWRSDGIDEVIYQILLDWKQANTSNARIGDLASVMWSCHEYDCVERLAESRKVL